MATEKQEKTFPLGSDRVLTSSTQGKQIGGFQPTDEVQIELDNETANDILLYWNNWHGQRKYDKARVEEYKRRMGSKLWFRPVISVARLVDEKRKPVNDADGVQQHYLLNGQHTLKAIVSTAITGGVRIMATIHFYDLTWNQIELLFSQFDDHKKRKPSDILGPVAKMFGTTKTNRSDNTVVEEAWVKTSVLESVAKAVHWVDHQGFSARPTAPTKDMLVRIVEDRQEFIRWLMKASSDDPEKPFRKIKNGNSQRIWRMGPIAVFYMIWKNGDRLRGREFIRGLTSPDRKGMDFNAIDELRKDLFTRREAKEWRAREHARTAWIVIDAFNTYCKSNDLACDYRIPWAMIQNLSDAELQAPTIATIKTDGADAAGIEVKVSIDSEIKTGTVDRRRTVDDEYTEPPAPIGAAGKLVASEAIRLNTEQDEEPKAKKK